MKMAKWTRRELWITRHSWSCGGWALPKRSPTTGIFAPPVLKTCFETARASFYLDNTKAEVDRFVDVVKEIQKFFGQ